MIPGHSSIVTTRHEITRDKTGNESAVFLAGLNEVDL
jgi:hypothetical protein